MAATGMYLYEMIYHHKLSRLRKDIWSHSTWFPTKLWLHCCEIHYLLKCMLRSKTFTVSIAALLMVEHVELTINSSQLYQVNLTSNWYRSLYPQLWIWPSNTHIYIYGFYFHVFNYFCSHEPGMEHHAL